MQFSNQGAVICKVSNQPMSKDETENLYLVIPLRLLTGSAFCFNEVSSTNSCSSLLFIPRALEQVQHKLIHLNHSKTIYFQVKRLKILRFTHRVHLHTPYGSQNKQVSLSCTDWFL
jgi:hypothetical protein